MSGNVHGSIIQWRHGRTFNLRASVGQCIRVCLVLLLIPAAAAWSQVSVKKIDYEGWKDCWEVRNPVVRLVVVPQIGGRIMEYSLRGENALWQNKDELGKVTGDDAGKVWRNYGGYKAWNAPESRWLQANPDCTYDSLPAQVAPLPDGHGLRVISTPIPHLGYQFTRDIILADTTSRVRLIEKMRNISDHEISWSIWDVTQVKVPCWIAFPLSNNSAFPLGCNILTPKGGQLKQMARHNNIGVLKYDNMTENWTTDAMAGWMAYIRGQLAYTKHWATRRVGTKYPDGGSDAAFYTCSKAQFGGYAEMEVMGPIVTLKPGEQTDLIEDWFLSRLNQSAKDIPDVIARLRLLQKRGVLPRGLKYD